MEHGVKDRVPLWLFFFGMASALLMGIVISWGVGLMDALEFARLHGVELCQVCAGEVKR